MNCQSEELSTCTIFNAKSAFLLNAHQISMHRMVMIQERCSAVCVEENGIVSDIAQTADRTRTIPVRRENFVPTKSLACLETYAVMLCWIQFWFHTQMELHVYAKFWMY